MGKIFQIYVLGSLSSTNCNITQLSPGSVFGAYPWYMYTATSVLGFCRKVVDMDNCVYSPTYSKR